MVGCADEDLSETTSLKGRKDQKTSEVVVVPAHFLFAVEADDLTLRWWCCWVAVAALLGGGGMLHQEVVEEGGDVEEDGLGVEEEFGEEGEVLGVQLGGS